jgi:hypothetical protein
MVPLSTLFDQIEQGLQSRSAEPSSGDGYLFSGNPHESVPRVLILDRRLTPLERNAWQVFRLQLNKDGITAFPTYVELQPYLASLPGSARASSETVARALTVLRLTRWLSLVRRRRDAKTGRLQGNLYVLHDEPLTPFEALQLDADYLSLVSSALTHASKAIRWVGYYTLKEIAEDPLLNGRVLPTRLQVLSQRLASQGWTDTEADHGQEKIDTAVAHSAASARHDPAAGVDGSDRNPITPASESEERANTAHDASLRNPKQDRTVRSSSNYKDVRTVPRERARLSVPQRFATLRSQQQAAALAALQQVEESLRQAVLDEWDARCRASTIRNPAGYLFGIIQKALRGEFHASAGHAQPLTSNHPAPTSPTATLQSVQQSPVAPQNVSEHIARLRSILRIP